MVCIRDALISAFLAGLAITLVDATSMKLDFLKMTDVRTDPIINPDGLSAHVHSFFGATRAAPSTTYADLRSSTGNTGNVKENKSLYWHPTIYKFNKETKTYSIQETSLFSTYYIWETGSAKAFPDGFKMVGGGEPDLENMMQYAECVNPGNCPDGDCERWNDFFPATTCDELEMSMRMPSCWDGVNLDSPDHRSHVVYPEGSEPDGACPPSHPVQLPQIRVFTRLEPYTGGIHLFSDGTGYFHADYFSGWEETFLQKVLDECENDSFEAMPTSWCENHMTFLDAPKNKDSTIVDKSKLLALQPKTPFDASAITTEKIDGVSSLPGESVPFKQITPRCIDPIQAGSRRNCHRLRFKATESFLGTIRKYKNKRACEWRRGKCQARDECAALKGRRNCKRYGREHGCVFRRRRCVADDE